MRRLGIWLIAVAVVLSGTASYGEIGHDKPALTFQGHNRAAAVAKYDKYDAQSEQGCHDAVAAADHDQAPAHSHDGLKCCGICNVANVIPAVPAIPVTFSYAVVTFYMGQHDLVGHLVALDPDIPKSLV